MTYYTEARQGVHSSEVNASDNKNFTGPGPRKDVPLQSPMAAKSRKPRALKRKRA